MHVRDPGWFDLFARMRSGSATPEERQQFNNMQAERSQQVLDAPPEELYEAREVMVEAPPTPASSSRSPALPAASPPWRRASPASTAAICAALLRPVDGWRRSHLRTDAQEDGIATGSRRC